MTDAQHLRPENGPSSSTGRPADQPAEPGGRNANGTHLRGHLGVVAIVAMVIAAAAPLTVIGGNVPLTIANGNGVGAPVGFIVAALVLVIFSVGFVAMTPHVTESGAFYAYVQRVFGAPAGVGAAAVAWVAYTAIQVGIYGYLGGSVRDVVVSAGGPELPWWVFALVAWLVVAALGYRNIDLGSKILAVLIVCEIGVMLVLDAAIVMRGGPAGFVTQTFEPGNVFVPTIGVSILFALTGFIGFESTAVYRDEARDPDRTIPRATYAAVTIIGVFYAASAWLLLVAYGPEGAVAQAQSTPATFMQDAMSTYVGPWGRHIMDVLLQTSLLACVLSFHNIVVRYQFTLAERGYLPRSLAQVHPRHLSPARSSLVQTVTALVFIVVFAVLDLDPLVQIFGSMAGVATIGFVLLLLATSLAVVVFFVRRRQLRSGLVRTVVAPALATVLLAAGLVLVLVNFPLVTSAPWSVSGPLALIPVVGFLAGWVVATPRARERR